MKKIMNMFSLHIWQPSCELGYEQPRQEGVCIH